MRHIIITALLLTASGTALAQESHYARALRGQDTEYGLVTDAPLSGVGMYWSRTRNVDDVAINKEEETQEQMLARRSDFIRLCEQAYDAFEKGDHYRTLLYGDSALARRFHTPDLYFFMAISSEKLGDYKGADWNYRQAIVAGYPAALNVYEEFKQRVKQLKADEKRKRKEEKREKKKKHT